MSLVVLFTMSMSPDCRQKMVQSLDKNRDRLSREGARWAYLVDPQFPHDDVVHRRRHFTPHVVISAGVELQVDVSCGAEKIGLNRLSSHRTALGKKVLPNGMTEIYFPRNLLSMVMCCQRVQPRCEITWWAAAGG